MVALLGAAAAIGAGVWIEAHLRRIAAITEYDGRPAAGAGTNWLLVGSDSRSGLSAEQQSDLSTGGEVGNGRTDTILLVHIPRLGSPVPATLVSIPRDSYLDIPGWGSDKVNAAYAAGGAPLLTQTVEQATGLRVDHYAEIGFGGFPAIVDAIGGVRICPSEPLDDPLAGITLAAGCQTVDGRTALGWVRSRATARADLDRMVHQREFMSALVERAASPWTWIYPWRLYTVPRALVAALTVDDGTHLPSLARLGWAVRGGATTVTVPIGEFTGNSSGAVVIWDSQFAPALFDALREDAPIPPEVLDAQP